MTGTVVQGYIGRSLMVLSLLEVQPRHGCDIPKLIAVRAGGDLIFASPHNIFCYTD